MKRTGLRGLLFSVVVVLVVYETALAAELIGLRTLPLEADELVWGFKIRLHEGRIVAVCNVPDGWKITAENYGEAAEYKDGGGEVEGGADFGHDALSGSRLSQLAQFLLLDRSDVHHKRATLTGSLTTSGRSDNRTITLSPLNFSRREAVGCPVPAAR